jgi:hypothetical protein
MDLPAPSPGDTVRVGPPLAEGHWALPVPDARVLADSADPAEHVVSRDTVLLVWSRRRPADRTRGTAAC